MILRSRFAGVRDRLEALAFASPWQAAVFEFVLFGFKQVWACLFGALMLGLLLMIISFVLVSRLHSPSAKRAFQAV